MRTVSGEDLVVLAPDDQRRRPMLAEKSLNGGIKRQVGPIVVEDVELNVGVARPIEQRLIMNPIVGRDAADVRDAVGVLKLRRLGSKEPAQRLAMSVRPVGPIGLNRIPELFEPLVIG